MKDTKTAPETLQAEEYIKKMMKKKRLLTGVELGNCLLCRIGYDIAEPTNDFILDTLNHWTSQADFDAYYLRLEIRSFLMLLHNSAIYAQAKARAEGANITQVIMQISKDRIYYNLFKVLEIKTQKPPYKDYLLKADEEYKKSSLVSPVITLTEEIKNNIKDSKEELKTDIRNLITILADTFIKEFTESITFILNADFLIDLFAEYFNLDLHTYKTKKEINKDLWESINTLDNEGINEVVNNALNENIIDKQTHKRAVEVLKKSSSIDTKEATDAEIKEVKEALKEMKTQADFQHLREWLIKTMIKTTRFI